MCFVVIAFLGDGMPVAKASYVLKQRAVVKAMRRVIIDMHAFGKRHVGMIDIVAILPYGFNAAIKRLLNFSRKRAFSASACAAYSDYNH